PTTCPHGGVIPRNNQYKELYTTDLLQFSAGDYVNVKRVRDRTELLVYLSSKAISIGDEVLIVDKDDTNRVVMIQKGETVTILSYDNAAHIYVE
ncbi:FeoA family protein, partial [Staphylococcus arlettae]